MSENKIKAIQKMRTENLPAGTLIQIEEETYIVAQTCGGTYIRNDKGDTK